MRSLLIGLALTAATVPASAVTITATSGGGAASAPVTNIDGPVNSGQVFSETIIPTDAFANMEARGALDIAGNAAVALNGTYTQTGKPHLAGIDFPQITDAATIWSSTVTNLGALPKSYLYSFLLSPFHLTLQDIAGISDTDPDFALASFSVEVRANNVLVFEAHATAKGGTVHDVLIETGADLGGVRSSTEGSVSYNFDQFQGQLSAGTAGPGESITVETKLIAHTESRRANTGGIVAMGDPLDLKGDPGVSSVVFEEDGSVGVAPASWSAAKQLYR
jgi:hypothetical protein